MGDEQKAKSKKWKMKTALFLGEGIGLKRKRGTSSFGK